MEVSAPPSTTPLALPRPARTHLEGAAVRGAVRVLLRHRHRRALLDAVGVLSRIARVSRRSRCSAAGRLGTGSSPPLFTRLEHDPLLRRSRSAASTRLVSVMFGIVAALLLQFTVRARHPRLRARRAHARHLLRRGSACCSSASPWRSTTTKLHGARGLRARAAAGAPDPAVVPADRFPRRRRLEVHAANVSSKEVSGELLRRGSGRPTTAILLAVADVSGKGRPRRAAVVDAAGNRCAPGRHGHAGGGDHAATINALGLPSRPVTGQFATFFLARQRARHDAAIHQRRAQLSAAVLLRRRAPHARDRRLWSQMEDAEYAEGGRAAPVRGDGSALPDGVPPRPAGGSEMFPVRSRLIALVQSLPGELRGGSWSSGSRRAA